MCHIHIFDAFEQSTVNCIRTIHLFAAAYPPIISSTKASTLLPYLKSPTSVRVATVLSSSSVNNTIGGGASDLGLYSEDISDQHSAYVENVGQVR